MIKWDPCTIRSYRLSFLLSTLNHLGRPFSSVLAFSIQLWWRADYSCLYESSVSTVCLMWSIGIEGMVQVQPLAFLFLQKVAANDNLVKFQLNICIKANYKWKNTAQILLQPRQNPEAHHSKGNWHVEPKRQSIRMFWLNPTTVTFIRLDFG